ncbi:MAG: DEAD/DEAH box helicase [Thermoplasmata archaeon]
MRVTDTGVPQEFLDLFNGQDYELYPHQEEAIRVVEKNRNLLLTVPTAAGKTLVAYIAIYRNFMGGRKTLYIVPLKALAGEKFSELRKMRKIGAKVTISIGDYDTSPSELRNYDIIICTSEKADSLVHHDPSFLYEVGLIVADELHLVGEKTRGPRLEMVLTAAKTVNPDIRILGLSATVANSEEIAKWLGADLVVSDFRPVPLEEGVVFRNRIYTSRDEYIKLENGSDVSSLAMKFVNEGGQVIIFRSSRKRAEETAINFPRIMENTNLKQELDDSEKDHLTSTVEELIQKGVAFHHAGLPNQTRTRIEDMFRKGRIKVISATPTLAAGINLPARAVLIRDITRYSDGYSDYLSNGEIRQMMGRAGRAGYDRKGYAYVYASSEQGFERSLEYMKGETEPVISQMNQESLIRFNILALISSGLAVTQGQIMEFFGRTLMSHQRRMNGVLQLTERTIEFLKEYNFISEFKDSMKATRFGELVSNLYIDPIAAITIREYLEKPFSENTAIYTAALASDVGFISIGRDDYPMIDNFLSKNGIEDYTEESMQAAKVSMIMIDWINETPIREMEEKFNIGYGDVQSRSSTLEWLLYSMARLSSLYKPEVQRNLDNLALRVREGVKEEIIMLTTIPGIGRVRARRLYRSGFQTVESVADADEKKLSSIFGFSEKLSRDVILNARRIKSRGSDEKASPSL